MILPCECPSPAHCLEATGGEQGLSADELARLRRELDDGRSRLATVVDEAFGPQEVLGLDELLTRLEGLLYRSRNETRKELQSAVDENGTLRLRCEDYRLDAVTAREERDELRSEVERRDAATLNKVLAEERDEARDTLAGIKRRVTAELSRIEREHCSACGNGRGLVGRLAEDVRSILSIELGEDVAKIARERDAANTEASNARFWLDDVRAQLDSTRDVLVRMVGAKKETERLEETAKRVTSWYESVRLGLVDALRQRDAADAERVAMRKERDEARAALDRLLAAIAPQGGDIGRVVVSLPDAIRSARAVLKERAA
jgi:hypothetical protein